jgi:hypothetical protein
MLLTVRAQPWIVQKQADPQSDQSSQICSKRSSIPTLALRAAEVFSYVLRTFSLAAMSEGLSRGISSSSVARIREFGSPRLAVWAKIVSGRNFSLHLPEIFPRLPGF